MRAPSWTQEQEQFIRDNYGILTPQQMSEEMPGIERSTDSVRSKMRDMGLASKAKRGHKVFPKRVLVERPVCKLLTCLFRDYATAPQKTVQVIEWEGAA